MITDEELDKRTAEIHKKMVAVDGHCHLMKELAARRDLGEQRVFKDYHLPLLKQGSVKALLMIVGGDNNAMIRGSDLMLWGALEMIDTFYQDLEECSEVLQLCTSSEEIDDAREQNKVAAILGLEGGRALEGRPMQDNLSTLRIFYRLGIRSLQLTGNGRNRLADGVAEEGTHGGLTRFGVAVVKEMVRLGMIIDLSHLASKGIYDVLDLTEGPLIASHSNVRSVCDHPRNLTDEIINNISRRGGVVGLTLFSTLVNKDKSLATVEDLVDHIDYIANLVGVEHVGLGPDFSEFVIRISQWTGMQGNMEGMQYGDKENYFHPELKDWTHFSNITRCLLKRGYTETDIEKIMGENLLRVYRKILKPGSSFD